MSMCKIRLKSTPKPMKTPTTLIFRRPFAGLLFASLFAAVPVSAATFYWDSTSPFNAEGFGDAQGTWAQNSTSNGGRWTTSATGTIFGNASQVHDQDDIYNFGTASNGLGSGSITVNGSVLIGNTNFGSASGAITLNGGTLNFGDARTITVNNTINTINSDIAGASTSLTKAGDGTLVFGGISTHAGATLVSAGTLLVNGALGNSTVSIAADATLGGTGTIAGDISFAAGSSMTVDISNPLTTTGTVTFGSGFGIANLFGIDWDLLDLDTPYTVLSTTQSFSASDIDNFGITNAASVGSSGREAYFETGSLQVIVIPEPTTALLGGIGLLFLMRRRRA